MPPRTAAKTISKKEILGKEATGRGTGRPNPVDVQVGARLRLRRTLLGMSQEKLGAAMGLTFQQVQKYERGSNRIGASRLFEISRILAVPVSYFFEDSDEKPALGKKARLQPAGLSEEDDDFSDDPLARRETLELIRAYYRINSPKLRRKIFDMIKAMAAASDEDEKED